MDTKPVRPLNKGGAHDIQPRRPASSPQAVASTSNKAKIPEKGKGRMLAIGSLVVVLVLVIGIWIWRGQQGVATLIKTDRYQSVTLDNGQVYFGRLTNFNDDYMKITDVYYLQPDGDADTSAASGMASNAQNPTLIKHGTEIQNPEDEIVISKEDIMLWENLKDSGKIVEAINNYKSQQGQ